MLVQQVLPNMYMRLLLQTGNAHNAKEVLKTLLLYFLMQTLKQLAKLSLIVPLVVQANVALLPRWLLLLVTLSRILLKQLLVKLARESLGMV